MTSSEFRSTNIFVAAGFTVKNFKSPYIPLFQRGTLIPPFEKGGQGGFFILGGEIFVVHGRLIWATCMMFM